MSSGRSVAGRGAAIGTFDAELTGLCPGRASGAAVDGSEDATAVCFSEDAKTIGWALFFLLCFGGLG